METKKIESQPRILGKAFSAFTKFQAEVKTGKRIIYHGVDWVAMDRKSYEDLVKRAEEKPVIEIDE